MVKNRYNPKAGKDKRCIHITRINRRMVYYFRKLRGEYLLKDDSIFKKITREYGNKCIACRDIN